MATQRWVRPDIKHMVPTKYGWMVAYPYNLSLAEQTDIGAWTFIQAQHKVEIGFGVQIGAHCTIYSANTENDKYGPVRLLRSCKVGAGTIIFPNVTIGENAEVGANCVLNASVGNGAKVKAMSLVLKDVPDGCVVGGVPAKIVTPKQKVVDLGYGAIIK